MGAAHQIGHVVGDRYLLVRLLGEGGMGEVWAATHRVTRAPVALKFLKGMAATRPDLRRRFLREARAATAVHHPNVVRIHDIFELADGSPVMVMDLLDGESLAARLKRGRMAPAEAAAVILPVVSAIGTAHAVGIVHRDLKPDNVFLVALFDGRRDVRVLDFGIAKLTASEGDAALTAGITQTGEMLGTPYYMAPEQASGEAAIDHRADIWAIGVILYECLAGARPVGGANLGQVLTRIITGAIVPLARVAPDVPADLAALVMQMLSHDRTKRPDDLRAVRDGLARYAEVSTQPFDAPQPQPATPDPRRSLADTPDPLAPTGASNTPDPLAPTGATPDPLGRAAAADPLAPTGATPDPLGRAAAADPLAPTGATPEPLAPTGSEERVAVAVAPVESGPPSLATGAAKAPFYRSAPFRYAAVAVAAVGVAAVTIQLAARSAATQTPAAAAPVEREKPAPPPVAAPPIAAPAPPVEQQVVPPVERPVAHGGARRKKHGADPAAAAAAPPAAEKPVTPAQPERLPGDISAKPSF